MATQLLSYDQIVGLNQADVIPASPSTEDYEFNNGTDPFAWGNQPASTTYTESGGKGRIFYPSAQTGVQIIGREKNITADATWEYTAKLAILTAHINYYEIDLFMRDSVGGRVNSLSMDARAAAVKRWNSMTSWNSETFGSLPAGWPDRLPNPRAESGQYRCSLPGQASLNRGAQRFSACPACRAAACRCGPCHRAACRHAPCGLA